jgi:hypothetical protein
VKRRFGMLGTLYPPDRFRRNKEKKKKEEENVKTHEVHQLRLLRGAAADRGRAGSVMACPRQIHLQ